jgi:predicted outer membrane repeat protein
VEYTASAIARRRLSTYTATVANGNFNNNVATNGGAIYTDSKTVALTVASTTFTSNAADIGGAIKAIG